MQRSARQPSHVFAGGILLITAADVGLALVIKDVVPLDVYFSGSWTLVVVMLVLDASRGSLPPERRQSDELGAARPDAVPVLRLLPYVTAVACILLALVVQHAFPSSATERFLPLWASIVILMLLMLRQVIPLLDNQQLARNLISANRELPHRASRDSLTDLLNRASFTAKLEGDLLQAQVSNGTLALFFIDLDSFKQINDTYGHLFGDELLRLAAGRLQQAVLPDGYVARLGGDEFVAAFPGLQALAAARVAERLLAALTGPYNVDSIPVEVGASIGVSTSPADESSARDLLQLADMAMYRSKRSRKMSAGHV